MNCLGRLLPGSLFLILGEVCIFNKNTWQFGGIFNASPISPWCRCSAVIKVKIFHELQSAKRIKGRIIKDQKQWMG